MIQYNSLTGKTIEFVCMYGSESLFIHVCSKFDGNFGGRGATIDFIVHNGKFENVTFNRNRGPVIRVSQ